MRTRHIAAFAAVALSAGTLLADDKADLALRRAVLAGDAAATAEAIKAGGSPNAKYQTISIAQDAATLREVAVLKVLKDSGVDLARIRHGGWNILDLGLADAGCKADFVRFALDAGLTPDRKNCPAGALSTLAGSSNAEIASMLIEAGASTDRFEGQSYSPLQTAVQFGSPEVVKLLLDRKADASVMPVGQWNLFHCLANRRKGDPHTAAIAKLIAKIDDPDEYDVSGWTPLMFACYRDNPAAAKVLIDCGASVKSDEGGWALVIAGFHGGEETIKLLLDNGAPPDADMRGTTPILATLYGSDPSMVDRMKARFGGGRGGTSGDAEDALPRTVRIRPIEKLRLLIAAGADVDAADDSGWTPLAAAARLWDFSKVQDATGRALNRPEVDAYLRAQDPAVAMRMLLEAGAKYRGDDDIDPISMAAKRLDDRREPLIKLLREAAAKAAEKKKQ